MKLRASNKVNENDNIASREQTKCARDAWSRPEKNQTAASSDNIAAGVAITSSIVGATGSRSMKNVAPSDNFELM